MLLFFRKDKKKRKKRNGSANINDHIAFVCLENINKYAAIMTKRAASVCMAILWIVPNAALFAYFSSIENQGFQVRQFSPELERNEFDQKIDGTILL